jgi:hypothetical protein
MAEQPWMKKWLMNDCRDMDNHHKIHLISCLATCRITGRDLRWTVLALLQFRRSTIFFPTFPPFFATPIPVVPPLPVAPPPAFIRTGGALGLFFESDPDFPFAIHFFVDWSQFA